MGVAIDQTGVTKSTTPTHFAFDYPVYLQNDTEYALVVETDSTDYELWSSKLGETDIATSTVIHNSTISRFGIPFPEYRKLDRKISLKILSSPCIVLSLILQDQQNST